MFVSVSNGSSLAGGNMSWLAGDYQHHNMSWSSPGGDDLEYRHQNMSIEETDSSFIYEAVVQGILVCLFTTVGGVMVLVFFLIMIQECKVSLPIVHHFNTHYARYCICGLSGPTMRMCSHLPTLRSLSHPATPLVAHIPPPVTGLI